MSALNGQGRPSQYPGTRLPRVAPSRPPGAPRRGRPGRGGRRGVAGGGRRLCAPGLGARRHRAATRTIRVGSGAVPLPGHPPPVVAEQTACFDGRHRDVRAVPEPARPPEFWPVGSSTGGAAFAGGLGLPYVDAPPHRRRRGGRGPGGPPARVPAVGRGPRVITRRAHAAVRSTRPARSRGLDVLAEHPRSTTDMNAIRSGTANAVTAFVHASRPPERGVLRASGARPPTWGPADTSATTG